MIPGYGMGNSLELNLQDRTGGDMATFYEAVIQFLGALNQRPEVAMAYTSYAMNFPQVSVDVDAAKCKRAGISPGAVLDALGSYCGGAYISNYNQFGKVYRVMMQASPEYRLDEQALGNMFVRNGTEMAPVSQFVTLNKVLGPETANRFNLYSAIAANVNPAEGYSSGEVQKVIAEVAEQTLPLGYGYEYGGMAREEANTGGAQTVFIYAICIFLIYLILACLYESFLDTVCGHLLRTVRADGFIPLCQGSGIGEQHLFADGCDYADWLARQDGHPDYGVCHRAAPQGNGHCGISLFGRPGPFASYPDDGADDDIRYASADVLEWCGRQR